MREGAGGGALQDEWLPDSREQLPASLCLDPREQKRKSALISALDRAGL